jgi:DNA-binding transcriptional ArsR family regulator
VDEVFRALADPGRRRLLDRLNDHKSVSKHLAILEAANLVTTVRRGRDKLHYLNAAPISDIAGGWINQYGTARVRALGSFG